MREAAGAFTGDEEKKAERERNRQRRQGKRPLGGIGDTLLGR